MFGKILKRSSQVCEADGVGSPTQSDATERNRPTTDVKDGILSFQPAVKVRAQVKTGTTAMLYTKALIESCTNAMLSGISASDTRVILVGDVDIKEAQQ